MRLEKLPCELLNEKIKRSKVSPEEVEGNLKKYVKKEYDYNIDELERVYVQKGGGARSEFMLRAFVPEEIVDEEDWQDFFKMYGYFVIGFGSATRHSVFSKEKVFRLNYFHIIRRRRISPFSLSCNSKK